MQLCLTPGNHSAFITLTSAPRPASDQHRGGRVVLIIHITVSDYSQYLLPYDLKEWEEADTTEAYT